MHLLGPQPLLFCRPIWVPPEKPLLLLHQPREKAHVCISYTPSSFLPASPLVSCLPWGQRICKQWDNWCSWQDTWQDAQQVGEPEAPKEGGSRWPPLSMWHPVEGWEAADRSPESIEKALQAVGSSLQTKRHELPLVLGVDFLDFLEGEYGQYLPWCCVSAWTAETGGRARAASTHEMRGLEEPSTSDYEVRRDDDGEPGETAGLRLSVRPQLCRKGSASNLSPPGWGEHPHGTPSVTEFTTYWPNTQAELVDLGKQLRQKQGERLVTWLLWLWVAGADSVICSGEERASITTHPSLKQMLQNARRLMQRARLTKGTPWWHGLTLPSAPRGWKWESSGISWVNGIPMLSWPKWWENWAWSSRCLTELPEAQTTSVLLGACETPFWTILCPPCIYIYVYIYTHIGITEPLCHTPKTV